MHFTLILRKLFLLQSKSATKTHQCERVPKSSFGGLYPHWVNFPSLPVPVTNCYYDRKWEKFLQQGHKQKPKPSSTFPIPLEKICPGAWGFPSLLSRWHPITRRGRGNLFDGDTVNKLKNKTDRGLNPSHTVQKKVLPGIPLKGKLAQYYKNQRHRWAPEVPNPQHRIYANPNLSVMPPTAQNVKITPQWPTERWALFPF